jgi:hypothetical protein
MTDDIIGMEDMISIYEITDRFGIDRESISVPLEKMETGAVTRLPDGGIEITAPVTTSTREWLPVLQAELDRLGFQLKNDDEDEA